MQYLKKKKMFEIAKILIPSVCDLKLKNCKYYFSRGTEWLLIYDNPYGYQLVASNNGNYLSVEKFFYYDDELSNKSLVYRKDLSEFVRSFVATSQL